jgi:hypothetical protein
MKNPSKKVLRQFPKAKAIWDENDCVKIAINDWCPVDDFFMPETDSVEQAWQYAAIALKTTQNFNRTHPDRMSLQDFEEKSVRILQRKRRGKQSEDHEYI